MRQCILHIIRHGQTDWNAEKRLQGHIDIPLNERGKAEAEIIAEEFKNHALGAIYSSPLQRAHTTAQIINRHHAHDIKTHDALKEATYGPYEGWTVEEYHAKGGETLASLKLRPLRERLHFKIAAEAESYYEVYQRVKPLLDQIIDIHLGEEVLIVSHGRLMGALIAMVAGDDIHDIQIENIGRLTLAGNKSGLVMQGHKRIMIKRAS
ncbi:MAG: histidine phosphatase family protein [Verrucomicrobia bacterium]|nr:histidine phosphatase family protein [Verrucomicrobiota bacterium]